MAFVVSFEHHDLPTNRDVRHIALKIKMRVCKYYYSNYVLE